MQLNQHHAPSPYIYEAGRYRSEKIICHFLLLLSWAILHFVKFLLIVQLSQGYSKKSTLGQTQVQNQVLTVEMSDSDYFIFCMQANNFFHQNHATEIQKKHPPPSSLNDYSLIKIRGGHSFLYTQVAKHFTVIVKIF